MNKGEGREAEGGREGNGREGVEEGRRKEEREEERWNGSVRKEEEREGERERMDIIYFSFYLCVCAYYISFSSL